MRRTLRYIRDCSTIPAQLTEIRHIWKKTYDPKTISGRFYDRYYTPGSNGEVRRGVICICDGSLDHGGITDRIRGMLTTYAEAERRGMPFYISWTSPFELTDYLVPAEVDWRIDRSEISYKRDDAFPMIIDEMDTLQCHADNYLRLTAALHNALPQTHIYSNADNARGNYAALYSRLFRPSELLSGALEEHLRELGTDYYAFSFRFIGLLGGFNDFEPRQLPETEARALIEKVTAEFRSQLSSVPASNRILVTGDSRRFLDHVAGIDPRIYIVPGDVKHVDYDRDAGNDVWLKTFVDQHLLMKAKRITLMLTGRMHRSGFPRFAAEVGGAEFVEHRF